MDGMLSGLIHGRCFINDVESTGASLVASGLPYGDHCNQTASEQPTQKMEVSRVRGEQDQAPKWGGSGLSRPPAAPRMLRVPLFAPHSHAAAVAPAPATPARKPGSSAAAKDLT